MIMYTNTTEATPTNVLASTAELLAGLEVRKALVEENIGQNVVLMRQEKSGSEGFINIQRNIKRLALDSALINAEILVLKGQDVEGMLENINKTLLDETPDFDVDRVWLAQKIDDIREIATYTR